LKDNDYDVEPYTEFMILPKNLEKSKIIVFGCPNSSKVRQAEIDTLKKFVKGGGGLFLLSLSGGDRGLMNNMSAISKLFGITFENTAIKDERNNAGLPTMPLIKDFTNHPLTSDIKDILVPSACTLKVTEKANVVAKTSDTADPPSQPVIAAAQFGKGRVICVGSYEIFRRGGGFKHKGNKKFAQNCFRWLSGITLDAPVDEGVDEQKERVVTTRKKTPQKEDVASKEMEQTLRRLVNAVFDLQKDIEKVGGQITSVEKNIESLRDQFQDFAEKTQDQLGVMIPAKQFQSEEENQAGELEKDIKSLHAELKSVEQLKDHIDQRHSSGAMPRETYDEQVDKLEKRAEDLVKKIQKKEKELEKLLQ
jgi:prefoldin subunit 5